MREKLHRNFFYNMKKLKPSEFNELQDTNSWMIEVIETADNEFVIQGKNLSQMLNEKKTQAPTFQIIRLYFKIPQEWAGKEHIKQISVTVLGAEDFERLFFPF